MPSGSFLSSSLEQLKSSDTWPVYDTLMFCASKNTDRIHVCTKVGIMWILGTYTELPFFMFQWR